MNESTVHLVRYRALVIALFVVAMAALALALASTHGAAGGAPQATNGVVHTNN